MKNPTTSSPARWMWQSLLCLWFSVIAANACSIPVFRYALDRWPADLYRLELAASADGDPTIADLLRNLGESSLNLQAVTSTNAHETRLLFPQAESPFWSGVLDSKALAELIDSPARSEIVRRLLNGDSAVWILLESGQTDLDTSEAARLEKRIRFLETVAALPEIDPFDPTSRLGPGPELHVRFSLLRLASGDTRETALRTMLLGANPDNLPVPDGPIAAVVFGRGRVLGAWSTTDLNDESIDEACLFLLGACSCQVKNLNPGWDLLLSVDWDEALFQVAEGNAVDPSVPAIETSAMPEPAETVTIQPASAIPSGESPAPPRSWRTVAVISAAGFLLGAVVLLSLFRSRS